MSCEVRGDWIGKLRRSKKSKRKTPNRAKSSTLMRRWQNSTPRVRHQRTPNRAANVADSPILSYRAQRRVHSPFPKFVFQNSHVVSDNCGKRTQLSTILPLARIVHTFCLEELSKPLLLILRGCSSDNYDVTRQYLALADSLLISREQDGGTPSLVTRKG